MTDPKPVESIESPPVVDVDVDDDPDEVVPAPRPPRRKGIYALPNAITLSALFASFYAIVMAMNGRFDTACIAIFAAAVLDSLDGRVARMTNTQSAFGEQMDSLSDMVSFGVAPALVMRRRTEPPRRRRLQVNAPQVPVINNIDVATESDPARIRDSLARQAAGPVRWAEIIRISGASAE